MLIKNIPSIGTVKLQMNPYSANLEDPLNEFMDQFLTSKKKKALYIHTPFCATKCKYCKWQSSKLESPEQLRVHYEEILPSWLEKFQRIFDDTIFDEVYLGGGTPTVVPPELLNAFFDKIPNFDKIGNKCMEASPDTLTTDHIDMFQKHKFKFLSIGIQTLDENISKKHGRPYISHQEVVNLSDYLNDRDIYFNYDMICYLDKGDIRDLPEFEKDLDFLMKECNPASITIHQEHYCSQSLEKTHELMKMIRRKLEKNSKWMCVNSDLLDEDVPMDAMYRAEYRIVSRDYKYMHHLWDKYNLNLKEEFDVLAIGSTPIHPLFSFVGDTIYKEEENLIYPGPHMQMDAWMYNLLKDIRIRKGLQEA